MKSCLNFALFASLLTCSTLHAEDWPSWRGPRQNGISSETGIATKWSRTENVAWKVPLPGPAGATPVVAGDHIFLTSVDEAGQNLLLICISTDGKELWSKEVAQGNQVARGDEGNSASPSPVTDGKHVWAFFGDGTLCCYDFDGKEVWKYNLQKKYGEFDIQFGMPSSPVLYDGVLYLQVMHGNMRTADPGVSYLLAVDAKTGKEHFKTDRPSDGGYETKHGYASAMLAFTEKEPIIMMHGADYISAHSLKDGHEFWRAGNFQPVEYDKFWRFVSSPSANEGYIIVPTCKKGPTIGLKISKDGSEYSELWRYDKTPDVPSPLIKDGLVYLCKEDGNLVCLQADTGIEVYGLQRTHRQRHRGSPVYADGKIYLTARDGLVTVVKAGKEFEILAQNTLADDSDPDESISSSPVISNGTLYLRSYDHLWAIREK